MYKGVGFKKKCATLVRPWNLLVELSLKALKADFTEQNNDVNARNSVKIDE